MSIGAQIDQFGEKRKYNSKLCIFSLQRVQYSFITKLILPKVHYNVFGKEKKCIKMRCLAPNLAYLWLSDASQLLSSSNLDVVQLCYILYISNAFNYLTNILNLPFLASHFCIQMLISCIFKLYNFSNLLAFSI